MWQDEVIEEEKEKKKEEKPDRDTAVFTVGGYLSFSGKQDTTFIRHTQGPEEDPSRKLFNYSRRYTCHTVFNQRVHYFPTGTTRSKLSPVSRARQKCLGEDNIYRYLRIDSRENYYIQETRASYVYHISGEGSTCDTGRSLRSAKFRVLRLFPIIRREAS